MADRRPSVAVRRRLWAECILFYAVAPLATAVFLSASMLFPVLFFFTAVGLALLHRTPGFRWSELWDGWRRIGWGLVAAVCGLAFATGAAIVQATAPSALFVLPLQAPALMAMIALLYPVLSALPQELVFRPLFFRRYAPLLPADPRRAVVLNAAVFALAHLMFWSWIVAVLTFAGGLAFAWSYAVRRNFAEALAMHALAGVIVFVVGMGAYFYSGNVVRPF